MTPLVLIGTPGDPGYWESIFDVIPFPVYVADHATYEIICANRAMRQQSGACSGQTCYHAVYRQDSPCFFCKMPELVRAGAPTGGAGAVASGRGSGGTAGAGGDSGIVFEHFNDVDDRWYQLREMMITWFDGRLAKYSIAVDISALKAVQNALAEAHAELALKNRDVNAALVRAEEATRAKSQFLAAVSHEIRTPKNAIIGLTGLLQREVTDTGQREKLATVADAAHHLLVIINDILDLSKIEAGKLTLVEDDVIVVPLMDSVQSLISDAAAAKGVTVVSEVDPALADLHLRGDRVRLSQVLLNYASNAVKFTEQGAIHLRARLEEDLGPTVRLRFEVEDTGIGIVAADRDRLFNAFEQADSSTTRKYGGTGLGLTINRRLAQVMGGEVGLDSRLGEGSTFWFSVPLAKAPAGSAAAEPVAGAEPERQLAERYQDRRLLLVEDNPVNQKVAVALLRETRLPVDVAENGARAVEMAAANAYDLILMDMHMPVMDGIEATRAIRRLPGHAATPIVAMTANAFDEERDRCLEAGMNDHLGKPVRPEVLFATLLHWLPAPKGE